MTCMCLTLWWPLFGNIGIIFVSRLKWIFCLLLILLIFVKCLVLHYLAASDSGSWNYSDTLVLFSIFLVFVIDLSLNRLVTLYHIDYRANTYDMHEYCLVSINNNENKNVIYDNFWNCYWMHSFNICLYTKEILLLYFCYYFVMMKNHERKRVAVTLTCKFTLVSIRKLTIEYNC